MRTGGSEIGTNSRLGSQSNYRPAGEPMVLNHKNAVALINQSQDESKE